MDDTVEEGHGWEDALFGVQPELSLHVVDADAGGTPIRLNAEREEEAGVRAVSHQESAHAGRPQEFSGLLWGETLVVVAARAERPHRPVDALEVGI